MHASNMSAALHHTVQAPRRSFTSSCKSGNHAHGGINKWSNVGFYLPNCVGRYNAATRYMLPMGAGYHLWAFQN